MMKFKRVTKNYMFPDYIREDGKITIRPNTARHEFNVFDEQENCIDTVKRLKDAKEKYSK